MGGRQAEAGSEEGGEAAPCCAPWWPRAPPALPPLSRPPPTSCGCARCPSPMRAGGGKVLAVPGVTREHSVSGSSGHQCAQRGRSAPGPPTPPRGRIQRPQSLSGSSARQPRYAPGLVRSSCCLTQRDASGLNVTSRRRLAGGAGECGRSPGSEGAGQLGTGFPLPLSPSVAVAASAAVRTDEGSEKQSFSTPAAGANSFFRCHSPALVPPVVCPPPSLMLPWWPGPPWGALEVWMGWKAAVGGQG